MKKNKLFLLFSTGFGSGYSPIASGTVGSLLSLIIWVPVYFYLKPIFYILLFAGIVFGEKICQAGVDKFKEEDPSEVVFDEIIGMGLAMMGNPGGIWYILLSFLIFRLYDILKFYPIGRMEEIEGGMGVFMDDVIAGLFTSFTVIIINSFI